MNGANNIDGGLNNKESRWEYPYASFKIPNYANSKVSGLNQPEQDEYVSSEKKNKKSKKVLVPVVLFLVALATTAHAIFRKPGDAHFKEFVNFQKASTMDEAIKFARENFKIKKFDFGDDLEFANWVNEGLTNINNRFKGKARMPQKVCFMDEAALKNHADAVAFFGCFDNEIQFNKKLFDIEFQRNNFETATKNLFKLNEDGSVNVKLISSFLDTKKLMEVAEFWKKYQANPNEFSRFELATINSKLIDAMPGIMAPALCLQKVAKNEKMMEVIRELNIDFDLDTLMKKTSDEQREFLESMFDKIKKEKGQGTFFKLNGQKCGSSIFDTLYHEMGHKLHFSYTSIWDRKFGKLGKKSSAAFKNTKDFNIAGEVSNYAQTNPFEFVAETFMGLVNGEKYSDDVMELYKKYLGPMAA